jgi:hypothetical protein
MSHRIGSHSARHGPARCAAYLAVALVGTASIGCGGSSATTRSGHASFVTSVGNVCARAVAVHTGHPFPLLDFNPERPDPNQLPQVASYFARYGGLPQLTAALHRLTPPTSDAAAWRNLLTIADNMTVNAQRQIVAARARDVAGFVNAVHKSDQLIPRLNAAGKRFGFTEQSACSEVFG